MRTITLGGRLGEEFGGPYRLSVDTPAEAVRALIPQLPGFGQAITDGTWVVMVGSTELDENQLLITAPGDYRIVPALSGAGGGGRGKMVGKIVVGVALTAAAFMVGGPGASLAMTRLASIGLSMGIATGLSGIAMMLAPAPHKVNATKNQDRSSYLFDGPVNSDQEGGVVPLVYGGPIKTGGAIISGSIVTETMLGWNGEPALGDPFLSTHTLGVGVQSGTGYRGFRLQKFGSLDPRDVTSDIYIQEVSYGANERVVYFQVGTSGLPASWLGSIKLYDANTTIFDLAGVNANGFAGAAGYTQWSWSLITNPMPTSGASLSLDVTRTV
jgi:predicted phage tail protein